MLFPWRVVFGVDVNSALSMLYELQIQTNSLFDMAAVKACLKHAITHKHKTKAKTTPAL